MRLNSYKDQNQKIIKHIVKLSYSFFNHINATTHSSLRSWMDQQTELKKTEKDDQVLPILFLGQSFVSIHLGHRKPGMQQKNCRFSSFLFWIYSKMLSTLVSSDHLCHVASSSSLMWWFLCLSSACSILWFPWLARNEEIMNFFL